MKVIYVAGTMRSGTTITGQMLSASPDTLLIGEVKPILKQPETHRHCDCGHGVDDCPFWAPTLARVEVPDVATANLGMRMVRIPGAIVALLARRGSTRRTRPIVELLRSIAISAGEHTVVDTTKTPLGIVLWRLAGAEVHVVHAVRGPRQFAAAQARPSSSTGLKSEPRLKSYLLWLATNLLVGVLRPLAATFTTVRHRALAAAPAPIANEIWQRAGVRAPTETDGRTFTSHESHMLAANPRRARSGSVTIKAPGSDAGRTGPLPDFAIIGAQKSGSTSLMHYLGEHPQVQLPAGESRYFLYPWREFQDPSVLRADVHTDDPRVQRRGIKCPDLLARPECTDLVLNTLGPIQIIAVLREPVSRALSGYFWGMQWGSIPVAPPEEGIRKILDGEYDEIAPRSAEVLDYGRYGQHLQRWLKQVPREDLLVIIDDDLRTKPAETLREAFTFLGVDPDVGLPEPERQWNSGVYSLARLRFLQLRHRYLIRPFPGYEGRYLQKPANPGAWFMDRAIAATDRLLLARLLSNSKPAISPQLRERLTDYYRDDITLLEELTGRDLSVWRRAQSAGDSTGGTA